MKVIMTKVLVKLEEKKEQTKAGLFIPDTASEDFKIANVVAVGDGTPEESMRIQVGDRVALGRYTGDKIEVEGEEYYVVEQKNILAVL